MRRRKGAKKITKNKLWTKRPHPPFQVWFPQTHLVIIIPTYWLVHSVLVAGGLPSLITSSPCSPVQDASCSCCLADTMLLCSQLLTWYLPVACGRGHGHVIVTTAPRSMPCRTVQHHAASLPDVTAALACPAQLGGRGGEGWRRQGSHATRREAEAQPRPGQDDAVVSLTRPLALRP